MRPAIRRLALAFVNRGMGSHGWDFAAFLASIVLPTLVNGEDMFTDFEREDMVHDVVSWLTRDMIAHADTLRRSRNVVVGTLATSLTW